MAAKNSSGWSGYTLAYIWHTLVRATNRNHNCQSNKKRHFSGESRTGECSGMFTGPLITHQQPLITPHLPLPLFLSSSSLSCSAFLCLYVRPKAMYVCQWHPPLTSGDEIFSLPSISGTRMFWEWHTSILFLQYAYCSQIVNSLYAWNYLLRLLKYTVCKPQGRLYSTMHLFLYFESKTISSALISSLSLGHYCKVSAGKIKTF